MKCQCLLNVEILEITLMYGVKYIVYPLANQKIVDNQSLRLERFNGLHSSVRGVNSI